MPENNENLTIDYSIVHIIHNSLIFLFKHRPHNFEIPPSFPNETKDKKIKNNTDELLDIYSSIQSCNINIILNAAAYVENTLEALLVAPSSNTQISSEHIITVSLKILRDEIIKMSSLEKYFDMYKKIYNKSIHDLVNKEELMCVQLLFDLRNMIIHCSILSGVVKKTPNNKITYLYVDEQLYLSMLGKIKKIFSLDESYYCLPETLLYWNGLIDKIFINVLSFIKKISNYSKTIFSYIRMPLAYWDDETFEQIINSKKSIN